ncbi:MAG: hypothetical protein ACAH24_23755 [Hyphomicrobiaceae bacterium]
MPVEAHARRALAVDREAAPQTQTLIIRQLRPFLTQLIVSCGCALGGARPIRVGPALLSGVPRLGCASFLGGLLFRCALLLGGTLLLRSTATLASLSLIGAPLLDCLPALVGPLPLGRLVALLLLECTLTCRALPLAGAPLLCGPILDGPVPFGLPWPGGRTLRTPGSRTRRRAVPRLGAWCLRRTRCWRAGLRSGPGASSRTTAARARRACMGSAGLGEILTLGCGKHRSSHERKRRQRTHLPHLELLLNRFNGQRGPQARVPCGDRCTQAP